MTTRERLRSLWWHVDKAGKWDRIAALDQVARSSERRRRWAALDEASSWAPSWAWDVSRSLADLRPGRNQELHRIAAWEARHIITNGGELALIALWLRAAGGAPPDPEPSATPPTLRLGQAARLVLMLGPGDVPSRAENLRMCARGAAACGGWAGLRAYLDSIDWSTPDAVRSLRAAVGAMAQRALSSGKAWNAQRARSPRLPEASVVGVADEGESRSRRRRRRRRLSTASVEAGSTAIETDTVEDHDDETGDEDEIIVETATVATADTPARKRRRRRRRRRSAAAGAEGVASADAAGQDGDDGPSDSNDASDDDE
jgi:hypothetical protein